ncbi:MAG: hypothetical protein ACUVQT_07680 [bacterium]
MVFTINRSLGLKNKKAEVPFNKATVKEITEEVGTARYGYRVRILAYADEFSMVNPIHLCDFYYAI